MSFDKVPSCVTSLKSKQRQVDKPCLVGWFGIHGIHIYEQLLVPFLPAAACRLLSRTMEVRQQTASSQLSPSFSLDLATQE